MKKLIPFMFFLLAGIIAHAQAKIEFEQETIDYGEVEYLSDGVRTFKFKNTGDEPLIIKDVKSTCGCTIPKKPEGAVAPGESSEIQVKYNTKKPGPIRRTVTVYSNAETPTVALKIKGRVKKKEE